MNLRPPRIDAHAFIAANLRLAPVPGLPAIRLHTAHQASGLGRLLAARPDGSGPAAPYWAYPWAGGLALAHHVLRHPETVYGRRILDFGAGSGLVGIAAALAGAAEVQAMDIDPFARAAIALNAAANGVILRAFDASGGPPPPADLVLAGDVFYSAEVAEDTMRFVDTALAGGARVLVGDPGRAYLPLSRLRLVAEYPVGDFGEASTELARAGYVFEAVESVEAVVDREPLRR